MDELKEQKTEKQVENQQTVTKEVFQPLEMKIVEVKVEKGYATSASPINAPQWGVGSW